MKNRKYFLYGILACVMLLFCSGKVQAGHFEIQRSPDGEIWTMYEDLPDYDRTGLPDFWYGPEEDFSTGIPSTLRATTTGEHYYEYDRKGIMPVGQWRVAWKQPKCIQGADMQAVGSDWHGLTLGDHRCQSPYFSGWFAYCADCLEPIRVNVYMSKEAAQSITQIPLGEVYYYLCPSCNHLEQGSAMKHDCKAVSYNKYAVRYEGNDDSVKGFMPDSFHMYNNAEIFEGSKVTPVKNLSLNSYTRTGYRFTGWNTEPDGSGTFFADGAEIFNLTEENYDSDVGTGIVLLYAQWERVASNLMFDANGGTYTGENPVRKNYGEIYDLASAQGFLIPPEGYRVSFQTNGGGTVEDMQNTFSFVRWDLKAPLQGSLKNNLYRFTAPMDATDTAVAVYESHPIILPAPQKPNSSFGGWYADEELTDLVGGEGDEYTPPKDVTLYAKWVELKLFSTDNYTDNDGKGAVDLRWTQPDREEKTYRLYQSGDGGASYQQISSVLASTEAEELLNRTFAFEKDGDDTKAQMVTIPSTGFYELTAAGAQGGGYGTYTGGLGGSVSGKFYLVRGEVLTVLVGGQDGTNGGGDGSAFGNGGGMTQVSSNLKGVLLTAGGGGGAGASGSGQPGGTGTNLVVSGSMGESGMSGGGGGYLGGAAGEYITHIHEEKCFRKGSDVLFSSYYHTHYPESWSGNPKVWLSSYDDYSDGEVDYTHVQFEKTVADPEKYDYVYAEYSSSASWAREVLQEKAYVRLLDQEGRELARVSPGDIADGPAFHNGKSIRSLTKEVLARCVDYEGNWGEYGNRVSSYTFGELPVNFQFSYVPTEGFYDGEVPHFEEKDYMVILTPVTNGNTNWVNLMVLSYRSEDNYSYYHGWDQDLQNGCFDPLKVGTNYIIYSNDRGSERYFPEGIYSEVTGGYGWSVPGAESFVSSDVNVVCRAVYQKQDADVTEITAQSLFVFDGGFCSTSMNIRGDYARTVCGYQEGQVISAKPAYGGSSYINEDHAVTKSSTAGVKEGDGSASVKGLSAGLTEEQELKGVKAPDRAAPDAVAKEGIRKRAHGSGGMMVSFEPVEDRGTEYLFYAESHSTRTGDLMCTSNLTKNLLKTGVKEYLYLVDESPGTVLSGTESGLGRLAAQEELCIIIQLTSGTRYLHLAAADRAGNVSATVHVEIRADDPLLFWQPYTEQLSIDSWVGGRDYENVYPAGDGTYYVKADGATPFLLAFDSHIQGQAREAYQIDSQIIDAGLQDGSLQRNTALLPHTVPLGSEEPLDGSAFVRRTEGAAILQDGLYIGASRSSQARNVSFYRAFTMDGSLNGQTVTVTPAAGAGTGNGETVYSDPALDAAHGLRLIPDGEAPVITGLEAFQSARLIERTQGNIVLEVQAADALSGVRDFYLKVENLDNFSTATYTSDENGVIRVEITKEAAIFAGDFAVTGYASDNVGNETAESWYVTEFSLETEVQRILSPHDPVFKRGESGILTVAAWGYVDRVEIVFPDFLSAYNQSFDYTENPDYKKEEGIQFMIPLYAPEGEEYEITVRAYKGDRKLEEHPSIRTLDVEGSVLDEIRTRLRG